MNINCNTIIYNRTLSSLHNNYYDQLLELLSTFKSQLACYLCSSTIINAFHYKKFPFKVHSWCGGNDLHPTLKCSLLLRILKVYRTENTQDTFSIRTGGWHACNDTKKTPSTFTSTCKTKENSITQRKTGVSICTVNTSG